MKKIACALALLLSLATPAKSHYCHEDEINTRITKVTDGDSVKIENGVDVRLVNIDTPEVHYQNRSQGEIAHRAADKLESLIPRGTQVSVKVSEEGCDRYGRILGTIYRGNLNINEKMVRTGLAVPYLIHPNLNKVDNLIEKARYAKTQGIGIYDSDTLVPYVWRRRVSHRGFEYYTGNYKTRCLYREEDYKKVAVPNRIFFLEEYEARKNFHYCNWRFNGKIPEGRLR